MKDIEILCSADHSTNVLTPRVWCVAWRYDGQLLTTCGDDKTIKIWMFMDDAESQKVVLHDTIYGDHSRTIRYVEFSRSGEFLASASFDATITVYEFKDDGFEEAHTLEGHENEIKCCAFSASDEFLATCSRDKTVWIWQTENDDYEVGSILQTHIADVKFVAWHPNENVLVSGGYDCSLRFYKYDGEDFITDQIITDAHAETIWSGCFDITGDFFVSCGADCFVKIWKRRSKPIEEQCNEPWSLFVECKLNDTRWPLYSVAWNVYHHEFIAVGGGDCTLRILRFDAESEVLTEFARLRLDAEINCVRWNPRRPGVLAASCDNGQAHIISVNLDF